MYRYSFRTLLRELAFVAIGIVFAAPVFVLINLSLKSDRDAVSSPSSLTTRPVWQNYSEAWNRAGNGFGRAMSTSVLVTGCSVLALLVLGTGVAYVLARSTSKLGTLMFLVVVLSLLMPAQLGTIPLYTKMRELHLLGKPLGLVVVYVGQMLPFTVFLITGFIRKLPMAYEQAAQVDGASRVRTLIWVVVPLIRPVLATTAVLNGLIIWNDFFLPLLWFGGSDKQTLPVALYTFVGQSAFQTPWNLVFAGIVIIAAPVLLVYIVAQKFLMRGFTSGVRG